MELLCLGPLEARVSGRPADLGEPQQRLVLAILLSHVGTVVSTDRLVDAIWGDEPPPSARKIVQGYVSGLRRALGPEDVVESRSPGYRLRATGEDVDAGHFAALVAEAADKVSSDPVRARALLGQALTMWRGSPYEDLADHDALRPEIVRLESLRMTAERLRIEADIYAGDAALAVAELEDLTRRQPLDERLWALRMLALYRSGRQADALRTFDEARRTLAEHVGLDPSPELRTLQQRILDQDPALETAWALAGPSPVAATVRRNPYKGLLAFEEADAADFYGRDDLVRRLREAVGRRDVPRLVLLAGPSGSGKSSVVRAGLFPHLRRDNWSLGALYPGPLEALETTHRGLGTSRPAAILVDQLEELASAGDDRGPFLDRLCELIEATDGPWIVATVRTDFLDRFLTHARFARLVEPGLVLVTPLDDHEVRDVVVRPASAVGAVVEPDLTAAIVADAADRTSALPLLEFALTDLYDRAGGKALSLEAYRAAGGIAGSLIERAEELYNGLGTAAAETTRRVFLQLVALTEDGEPVRRRRKKEDLSTIEGHDAVLEVFGRHRLLTFDRDAAGVPTVGVAHEALLTHWPRLWAWIDDARDSIAAHRRLAEATAEWEGHDRNAAYLLTGPRLAVLLDRSATDLAPTIEERSFLDRSQAAQRRTRRRRAAVAWSLVAVFAILAGVAGWQRNTAQREARQANARRVAGESALSLAEDPERSILLALAAVDLSRNAGEPPVPEAIAALQEAVQTLRLEARLDGGALSSVFSPDGTLLVTDMADPETGWPTSEVVIWDAETRSPLRSLVADAAVLGIENRADGGAEGRAFAFSPDGRHLAVAYQTDPDSMEAPVIVWDPATGEQLARLTTPGWVTWDPTWSADGAYLTTVSWDGGDDAVTTWEAGSWNETASIRPGFVGAIAAYRDDTIAVTHGPEERVGFYDVRTGAEVDVLATPGFAPIDVAVDPGGDRLVLDGRHGFLHVWDMASRTLQWSRPISSARAIAVSPDGATIAVGGDEGLIRLLDLDTGDDVISLAGPPGVANVAFSPGSDLLTATHVTGTHVWNVTATGPAALGAIAVASGRPYMLDVSTDGIEVAVSTWDGTFERRATGGGLLDAMDGLWTDPGVHPVVSRDWGSIALVTESGAAEVRRLSTGAVVAELPPCTNPRALSPDGAWVLVDGWWLCEPATAPTGADLHSRVLDVASGAVLVDLGDRNIFRAAFNPDGELEAGRYVAVNYNALEDGVAVDGVDVIDMASGDTVLSLDISPTMIAFDPSGRYLASGTYDGRVMVVDVAAVVGGRPVAEAIVMDVAVATGLVSGVALTTDGVLATAASESPFVRLWDVATGDLIVELRTDLGGGAPPRLAFSPDGAYLLYPTAGNVLRRFPLDPDTLIDLAGSRVTRTLTDDECRRYLDIDRCP